MSDQCLVFQYTNYKGETDIRRVIPKSIEFGLTPNIQEPTWILSGYDLDKSDDRRYVMTHIFRFIEE